MNRDPFYQEILKRLKGKLDPDDFEHCAADLLATQRSLNVVPISGGSDGGMDGAVADFEGEAFPLICTTGTDVIGNLTKNLKSYLKNCGDRKKVVCATSQKLTPIRITNLKKRASELGFVLVQVYEQTAVADMLYRDPKWTNNLLNLAGDPPPLSVIPVGRIFNYSKTLIGRETELKYLKENSEDLLISGQPGSGKTSLLLNLAKEGQGLFVVDEDRGRLVEGLRAQSPTRLFVDDAHLKSDLILRLKHLRNQLGLKFQIISTCWPGQTEKVCHTMDIPEQKVIHLPRLTRADILEVIKSCDIYGPPWLQREIINQANGQPGLAVTLSEICKTTGLRDLFTGNALRRNIIQPIREIIGDDAVFILAAFAVGGEEGMNLEDVTNFLGLPKISIAKDIANLATAGVIFENPHSKLISVRPPALREALIGEVFFRSKSPTVFKIRTLIEKAPDIVSVFVTLCNAKKRAFNIDNDLLIELLKTIGSQSALEEYAAIGKNEFTWVISQYPSEISHLLAVGLEVSPEETLLLLLNKAVGDNRMLNSNPDHPFRVLEDWVKRAHGDQILLRRKLAIKTSIQWFQGGGDKKTFIKAVCTSLTPDLESRDSDVVDDMKIHMGFNSINKVVINALRKEWPEILSHIATAQPQDLRPIIEVISEYLYGSMNVINESSETKKARETMAAEMTDDILKILPHHEGFKHWIARIQIHRTINLKAKFKIDKDFIRIFPLDYLDTEESKNNADSLADEWLKKEDEDIEGVVERYVELRKMADGVSDTYPRYDGYVFSKISKEAKKTEDWIRVLLVNNVEPEIVLPFIYRLSSVNNEKAKEILRACLKVDKYKSLAVLLILQTQPTNDELFNLINDELPNFLDMIQTQVSVNRLKLDVIRSLLKNENSSIALATAIGLWIAHRESGVPDEFKKDWEEAIIKGNPDRREYWFKELLTKNPQLVLPWLKDKLNHNEGEIDLYFDDSVKEAIRLLTNDDRKQLIKEISPDIANERLIRKLVASNQETYRELLKREDLKRFHLAPLRSDASIPWLKLANDALEAGLSEKEILDAILHRSLGWSGLESEMWAGVESSFRNLLPYAKGRICNVLEAGAKHAQEMKDKCLDKEKEDDF